MVSVCLCLHVCRSAVTSVLEAAGHEGLPTVSVVLVTYNRAELVQHALASLRQQVTPDGAFTSPCTARYTSDKY